MNRRRFLPLLAVVPVAAAVVCGAGDRRILSADDNELIFGIVHLTNPCTIRKV